MTRIASSSQKERVNAPVRSSPLAFAWAGSSIPSQKLARGLLAAWARAIGGRGMEPSRLTRLPSGAQERAIAGGASVVEASSEPSTSAGLAAWERAVARSMESIETSGRGSGTPILAPPSLGRLGRPDPRAIAGAPVPSLPGSLPMRIGITGFPGSGKSSVFQALSPGASSSRAGVALGNIKVPDPRVDRLTTIFKPKKQTYAEITFMDVPGTPGRSSGAFPPDVIQHMRNADVLVQVVRAFENPMLTEPADPKREISAFHDELILIDLGVLEKRAARMKKEQRKDQAAEVTLRCVEALEDGRPLRELGLTEDEEATLTGIQLLSLVPLLTLVNVAEDDWEDSPWRSTGDPKVMALCASLEAEVAQMPEEDQAEFLAELGLGEPARNEFIRTAYAALELISFLTAGTDECRAWPIHKGSTARKAAGKIHSDLERGFIRAEIYRLEDLERLGTEAALKAAGLMRVEGREYIVVDGDVMHVRANV